MLAGSAITHHAEGANNWANIYNANNFSNEPSDDSTYVLRKYNHGLAVLQPDQEQAPSDERSGAANSIPHNY